jgi:hypothetical protein
MVVCVAAAAGIARERDDTQVVEEALGFLAGLGSMGIALTPEQAAEVLRKEKTTPKLTSRAPSLRGILGPKCDCPECRRARGEAAPPFDDFGSFEEFGEDDTSDDSFNLPPERLVEELAKALPKGTSLEAILNQILRGGRKKKRRRK